jgi:hypothetical protein
MTGRLQPMMRAIGAAVVLGAPVVLAPGAGARTAGEPVSLSLYGVVTKTAFVNNADDRARGEGRNPFGNYTGTTAPIPTNELLYGPLPGDMGEYLLRLSKGRGQTAAVGSAILICQYNFNQDAMCDFSAQLPDGTLAGKGTTNFDAHVSSLSILGGTGQYRGMSGTLRLTAQGLGTQRQPVKRAVPILQGQRMAIQATAPSTSTHTIGLYTAPAGETFVNNDDDEARGGVNNPTGSHIPTASADEEKNRGPYPGDEGIYQVTLYKNADLTHPVGTATYTCQYQFFHNGLCDASYQIGGGTLIAEGALVFSATRYSLAVTGGIGTLNGQTGQVDASGHGKNAQHLTFTVG